MMGVIQNLTITVYNRIRYRTLFNFLRLLQKTNINKREFILQFTYKKIDLNQNCNLYYKLIGHNLSGSV